MINIDNFDVNSTLSEDKLETPLMLACMACKVPIINLFIWAGAVVNAVDAIGNSPIIYLLKSKKNNVSEAMLLLLYHGANPFVFSSEG